VCSKLFKLAKPFKFPVKGAGLRRSLANYNNLQYSVGLKRDGGRI
jgi:hypothetical protein